MRILITGTAGFIGFHLAKRMLEAGFEVVGLDCINDYYDIRIKHQRLRLTGIDPEKIVYNQEINSNLHENYKFIQLKLEDREHIENLMQKTKPNVVVNLAAQAGVRYSLTNPFAYIESNLNGYFNLLESCRQNQVDHFVYASSSSVYGLNESMPLSTNQNVDHPVSLYAATKKSNELMAHAYSHLYGLPTTGLRFFTVYGPWGRPDMALFIFTKAIIENQPVQVFNHGEMYRDFTYIDDIVEGIYRVINKKPSGKETWSGLYPEPSSSKAPYRVYNIGNNNPIRLLDFIEEIERNLGKKANKILLPIQKGDVPVTMANVDELIEDFNYRPSTSTETGIRRFIEWYKEYYQIKD